MPAAPKSPLVRELQWLLGIMVAAVPLAFALHALIEQVPSLYKSLDDVLVHSSGYLAVTLYVLAVLGCYLGRLGALVATRLATRIPQEAGRPQAA